MKYYQIDKDHIGAIAEKVLMMMLQHKIPLYPENYLVWFDYVSGGNKELAKDINQIIGEGQPFTDEINDGLYRKYFHVDDSVIEDAQKEILTIVKHILDEIHYTRDFASEYRRQLEEASKQLESAKSINEINGIVANLMKVTVEVIRTSEQLKEHLHEATSKSEALQTELENILYESRIDPLTGIYNRKAFDYKIEEYVNLFSDDKIILSVVLIDIDNFKEFNDQYGHLLGDQVLKFMGKLLTKELKGKDFVARYGGEEFIILMENTSIDDAYTVADKIRKSLDGVKLKYVKTGQVLGKINISAGVAAIRKGDIAESLVRRADDALYLAKRNGRNNVKTERDLPDWHESSKLTAPAPVEFLMQ